MPLIIIDMDESPEKQRGTYKLRVRIRKHRALEEVRQRFEENSSVDGTYVISKF